MVTLKAVSLAGIRLFQGVQEMIQLRNETHLLIPVAKSPPPNLAATTK